MDYGSGLSCQSGRLGQLHWGGEGLVLWCTCSCYSNLQPVTTALGRGRVGAPAALFVRPLHVQSFKGVVHCATGLGACMVHGAGT